MSRLLCPARALPGLIGLSLLLFACGPSSPGDPIDAGVTPDAPPVGCALGEIECAGDCCIGGEICDVNTICCAIEDLCGAQCCGAGEVCEGSVCQLDCGADERCTDDNGASVCCASGELCTSEGCFAPTTACLDFIDCPAGEYCEPELGQCLPQPTGAVCQEQPTGGKPVPSLVWHWDGSEPGLPVPTSNQVMMTPMVANLTDDNGDLVIDQNDIPDVVFISYSGSGYTQNGILRVVSGDTGATHFSVTDPAHYLIPGGQVAIGDIDGDDLPEIVGCNGNGRTRGPLIAFEHDGTFKWRALDPGNGAEVALCGQAAPAIADLDADGTPEVFVRHAVVDGATGELEWEHECTFGARTYANPAHDPCDYSTAADLDGDGQLELVGGNIAYRANGAVYYDHTAEYDDGYPAIGDLDLDGTPEVVVVQSSWAEAPLHAYEGMHEIRALDSTGATIWGPSDVNADNPNVPVTTQLAGGGPPTVANFDNDEEPEIALATAFHYIVLEADGSTKWYRDSQDNSSRKTGSSVFDFNGDGVAEVVYSDHWWMRVYDGPTGDITFCLCNPSGTLWEYPVTVDVNNDGATEIVVASNTLANADCPSDPAMALDSCTMARMVAGETARTFGVRVFASPTEPWVPTRRVWNQHTYHVTNVSEASAIPQSETRNWTVSALNNFRQNVQPGAANQPDLQLVDPGVDLSGCPTDMRVDFSVINEGWSASPPGVPVAVYVELMGVFTYVGEAATTQSLLPGQSELLSLDYPLQGTEGDPVRFRLVVNDPNQTPLDTLSECRPDNNSAETDGRCSLIP